MREIKFRGWHKHSKKIYRVLWMCLITGEVELDVGEDDNCWHTQKNVVLMQYTGLKDKNGKEIYEGDIVSDNLDYIRAVVFHPNGYFALKRDRKTGISYADLSGVDGIVIGNIYENPELLKGA